jgi:hypothetical protein
MSRRRKIAIAILVAMVVGGAVYLPGLYRRVVGLKHIPVSEEAERRAVVEPPISTSTDEPVKARMFWASATVPGTVDETDVDMKLSADPVERGKQLIIALVGGPDDPSKRTLPAGTALLEFYLLPEGTAVADFSSVLSTNMPSGIQSEQLAVESIGDTLAANIPNLRRLKILIDGQEAKTLAGHIDLTGYFLLHAPAPAAPAAATNPEPATLTAPASPGKLKR